MQTKIMARYIKIKLMSIKFHPCCSKWQNHPILWTVSRLHAKGYMEVYLQWSVNWQLKRFLLQAFWKIFFSTCSVCVCVCVCGWGLSSGPCVWYARQALYHLSHTTSPQPTFKIIYNLVIMSHSLSQCLRKNTKRAILRFAKSVFILFLFRITLFYLK
jgi:hypothetical protein